MAWVSWHQVFSSTNYGGLGIGSLHAANLAMLVKWVWRFHSEPNSLWKSVITFIHGSNGGGLVNATVIFRCNFATVFQRVTNRIATTSKTVANPLQKTN
ncbi:reverse transcriptase domain, Reverse transcriptase zinc-binding domain protein [Artemisia annua]|uniref:Reverse transcriptase domain, Reverse transcriptase zinc-binding domain protein n=1 Tax=Artemisia annua TaxID=35608 RepID=A0A2U1PTY4_ARTAN|nr:reverse transcriptase domain, Reverse transcriptase zinc-binding domain protein [Artemisia annua]